MNQKCNKIKSKPSIPYIFNHCDIVNYNKNQHHKMITFKSNTLIKNHNFQKQHQF